jgi:hypothetical protein
MNVQRRFFVRKKIRPILGRSESDRADQVNRLELRSARG